MPNIIKYCYGVSQEAKVDGTIITSVVLVFVTERKNNVDPCLRSQTNVNYYTCICKDL